MKSVLAFILLIWAALVLTLTTAAIVVYDVVHDKLDGRTAIVVALVSVIVAVCITGAVGQLESGRR